MKKKKTLTLVIKQKDFDDILAGNLKTACCEIRPYNVRKLVQLDDELYELEDEKGNAIPIHYDYLRLYAGYKKGRDTMLIEVTSEEAEMFYESYADGTLMTFIPDENGNPVHYMADENDEFIRDEEGYCIVCPPDYEGNWKPILLKKGVEGAIIPRHYFHNGDLFVEEQVIYHLGNIIERGTQS